jgi:hypothetical protein
MRAKSHSMLLRKHIFFDMDRDMMKAFPYARSIIMPVAAYSHSAGLLHGHH